jgi:hypothetical protein
MKGTRGFKRRVGLIARSHLGSYVSSEPKRLDDSTSGVSYGGLHVESSSNPHGRLWYNDGLTLLYGRVI